MTAPQDRPAPDATPEPELTMRLGDPAATVRLTPPPADEPVDPLATVRLTPPPAAKPVDPAATVRLTPPPADKPVNLAETVRLTPPPAAAKPVDVAETVRLTPPPAAKPVDVAETVRLTPPPAAGVAFDPSTAGTVRLSPGDALTVELEPPAAAATVRLTPPGELAESATMLDEEAWATPAVTVEVPGRTMERTVEATVAHTLEARTVPTPAAEQPDALRRFGPGVPSAAAAAWHGGTPAAEPAKPRRRRLGWLVPLLLLLAVLGYLAWQRSSPQLAVTGVAVSTDPAGPGCDGTATVTGSLQTNGGAGTVSYRWRRSDGTVSDDLTQQVPKGTHQTDVTLRWTFEGKGALAATATLEILSPGSRTASTSFSYTCR